MEGVGGGTAAEKHGVRSKQQTDVSAFEYWKR